MGSVLDDDDRLSSDSKMSAIKEFNVLTHCGC